jgi:hypothetical protein
MNSLRFVSSTRWMGQGRRSALELLLHDGVLDEGELVRERDHSAKGESRSTSSSRNAPGLDLHPRRAA